MSSSSHGSRTRAGGAAFLTGDAGGVGGAAALASGETGADLRAPLLGTLRLASGEGVRERGGVWGEAGSAMRAL